MFTSSPVLHKWICKKKLRCSDPQHGLRPKAGFHPSCVASTSANRMNRVSLLHPLIHVVDGKQMLI